MTSNQNQWAELRARGAWVELWADIRATGTVDDLVALHGDLSPEEHSADNAARESLANNPAAEAAISRIAERPIDQILDRIEQTEGPEQRELAEAGRKLALAQHQARQLNQPA